MLVTTAMCAALGVAACNASGRAASDSAAGDSVVVVDADSQRVALPGPARRIVSLVPSATLTLDALGARDRLVARTDFDTASWAASRPSVGGGLQPSIESIVAVHPDLVIRFGGPQDTKTPAHLAELGIPQIAIRPDRIADVLETVRLLGRVTGRAAAADSVVDALRSAMDSVRRSVAGLPLVRTAYVLGGSPPWVAGSGTYIDELIRLGGGVNVFSDLDTRYAPVSPEELISRHIAVVLVPPGSTFDRHLLPDARVLTVNGALELPGPALADAARDVALLLHPEIASRGGS